MDQLELSNAAADQLEQFNVVSDQLLLNYLILYLYFIHLILLFTFVDSFPVFETFPRIRYSFLQCWHLF